MTRSFFKMEGAGNDYLYFDCLEEPFPHPAAAARRLCDRHFSVGGDGIVLILPSARADVRMRIFNADGSEGKMCGNAVRCVGKYLRDVMGIGRDTFTVETRAGIRTLTVVRKGRRGEALSLCVDMGTPVFKPEKIPARFEGDAVIGQPLRVGEETFSVTCLSMGNPHCVVFCDDPAALDLSSLGPRFERHPAFPERVNTEFAAVTGENTLTMRVFERGSGETLACGTGACAAAVAAVLNGYCGEEISVRLPGGELGIRYTGGTVFMTGPANIAFTGAVAL